MLDMSDVDRVTWLCQQLDAVQLLNQEPLPLSQSVLLSLMQQLGSQLGKVGTPPGCQNWTQLKLALPKAPCLESECMCSTLVVSRRTDMAWPSGHAMVAVPSGAQKAMADNAVMT